MLSPTCSRRLGFNSSPRAVPKRAGILLAQLWDGSQQVWLAPPCPHTLLRSHLSVGFLSSQECPVIWGQWEGHSTAQAGLHGSAGGCQPSNCAFRCCGQVLAPCISQEFWGTALQSSRCSTRSSDRTLLFLELLNSEQKQRGGSARRKLLENEAHELWERAPGEGDTQGRVLIKAGIKATIQISLWGQTGMAPCVATLPRGPSAPTALPQQPSTAPPQKTPRCLSQRDPAWQTRYGKKALTEIWRCSNYHTRPREGPPLMSVIAREFHS